MKTQELIDGLLILQKYRDDKDGYNIDAEHDIFYAHATDMPLEKEDIQKMIDLGWFQEDVAGDEYTVDAYDFEEGWAAYT